MTPCTLALLAAGAMSLSDEARFTTKGVVCVICLVSSELVVGMLTGWEVCSLGALWLSRRLKAGSGCNLGVAASSSES